MGELKDVVLVSKSFSPGVTGGAGWFRRLDRESLGEVVCEK